MDDLEANIEELKMNLAAKDVVNMDTWKSDLFSIFWGI